LATEYNPSLEKTFTEEDVGDAMNALVSARLGLFSTLVKSSPKFNPFAPPDKIYGM